MNTKEDDEEEESDGSLRNLGIDTLNTDQNPSEYHEDDFFKHPNYRTS